MTDGQTLFAVFALLYLVECLRLMPSMAWVAAGAGKSRWKVLRPWARLQVGGGSPLLLSALPPMTAHTVALPWLFIPAVDGLRVRLADSMTTLVAWDKMVPRAEEGTLHLDASTHVKLTSASLAQTWAVRLAEWRDLPPEKRRSAFLKQARASIDPKQAEKIANETAKITRGLRRLATILFVWCFGIISAVYHRFGDGILVLSAAGILLLLQMVQAWLFLRCTRSIKHTLPYRRWRALGIAFLPQLAMRAADAVSLATEEEPPHPLAWKTLLDDPEWLANARQFWREARYIPGWPNSEALPPEAEALQTFFRQAELAESDYDVPSTAKLPTCPRCGAEFQLGVPLCKDCGGVELREPAAS